MKTTKNNNSVLLLATLGVYLGLVLAGATPQVLAQAAVKLDLKADLVGKYPCPNSLISNEKEEDIRPFDFDLANRLRELAESTKVRLEFVTADEPDKKYTLPFFYTQVNYAPYLVRGQKKEFDWNDYSSKWASAAHAGEIAELHSHFLTPLADCNGLESTRSRLTSSTFRMDEGGVHLDLFIQRASVSRADSLADFLNTIFAARAKTASSLTKSVYENTKALSSGRDVMIVTRLPRAGLDSLLASRAQ